MGAIRKICLILSHYNEEGLKLGIKNKNQSFGLWFYQTYMLN
jgi:hypothetical protein